MKKSSYYSIFSLLIVLFISSACFGTTRTGLNGQWTLLPKKSSDIGLYGVLSLDIRQNGSDLTLIQKWGGRRSFSDTLVIKTAGKEKSVPIVNRVFPTHVFMGLSMPVGLKKQVKAVWDENTNILEITEKYKIHSSQGLAPITSTHTYKLSDTKELLEYYVTRSTREEKPQLTYVFKPANTRNSYYMELEPNWEIDGKLPEKAFLISLQGIANLTGPNFYFIYPKNYPFTYTQSVFDFYKDKRSYTFT
ncbi:hypothetical protein KAH55_15320, partial [bacterium]|nr:hypothetical protein [bacterium]